MCNIFWLPLGGGGGVSDESRGIPVWRGNARILAVVTVNIYFEVVAAGIVLVKGNMAAWPVTSRHIIQFFLALLG